MRLDDAVAFGVERHGTDGRPVAGAARPARRVSFARPAVQRLSGRPARLIPGARAGVADGCALAGQGGLRAAAMWFSAGGYQQNTGIAGLVATGFSG